MIGGHELRRLAVESMTDPRTCRAYLEGRPVRELSAERIQAAIRRLRIKVRRRGRVSRDARTG